MTPNKAKLIDGKDFSNQLIRSLIPDIKTILKIIRRPPTLAVILVGEDGASQVYVRNKVKQTEAAGMVSVEHRLSDKIVEETLLSLVETLNNDDNIDGILVQLPLPKHINEHSVIQAINPDICQGKTFRPPLLMITMKHSSSTITVSSKIAFVLMADDSLVRKND